MYAYKLIGYEKVTITNEAQPLNTYKEYNIGILIVL